MSQSKTETTDPRIVSGRDAIRVMLNLSAPYDRPNTRISTIMDQLTDAEGRTMRVRLEALWDALKELDHGN